MEGNGKRDSARGKPLVASLGASIRSRRVRLGISQETLAERAGLHRTYIAGIEGGGRNITLKSIEKLAQALDLSVGALLSDSDSGPAWETPGLLLAEGNTKYLQSTLAVFREARLLNKIDVVRDGQALLDFLFLNDAHEGGPGARLPQILLLDLNLPKVRALEVLRRIKAGKQVQSIHVIVLSGGRTDEPVGEAMRLGAAACVAKPLDFPEFSKIMAGLNFDWALCQAAPRA